MSKYSVRDTADVTPEGPPAMLSGCFLTLYNINNGDLEDSGYPADWTEADFKIAGYEIVRLTDTDLAGLPTVNETLQNGSIEVPLSDDEAMRIARDYRGKIVEHHGSYYLIDFILSQAVLAMICTSWAPGTHRIGPRRGFS